MEFNAIIEKTYLLSDEIRKQETYLKLKEQETIIKNLYTSDNHFLSYMKLKDEYEKKENDDLLKQLHLLKLQIDSKEEVIKYKSLLKEYNLLLQEVLSIINNDII